MSAPAETSGARLLHLLRSHAAQSGPFRPADALRAIGPEATSDPLALAEALSKLHTECSIMPGPAGDLWLYRPGMRRKVQDSGPPEVASSVAPDGDIADAQAGRGDFAPGSLDRLIATSADADRLEALAVALERAGPQAPGHDRLVTLRSALNAARDRSRSDAMLAQVFVGRTAELARIADWIGRPEPGLPVRTLLVGGPPGIGKSLLLEQAVRIARQTRDPLLIRLDFERPALGSGEDGTLFDEISRQVADNLPTAAADLRALRLAAAEERVRVERGSARRYLPRDLLAGIVAVVRSAARPVLVLLDTLEVLQSRGVTFPDALMASFDRMVEAGLPDLTVIAAGRGPVFLVDSPRVAGHLVLAGLDAAQSRQVLAARGVNPSLWAGLLATARGNPQFLALSADTTGGAGRDGTPLSAAAGCLHRAILGRLPEDLRPLTLGSLILRRIDAATLQAVVAPALGLVADAAQADRLLAALAEQSWLTRREPGGVAFRSDMRAGLLDLIHADQPALAARVDARAAAWFADRDPGTALYHRLQAVRSGAAIPRIPRDLAAGFPPEMLDELPDAARDAVRRAGRSQPMPRMTPNPADAGADRAGARLRARNAGLWLRHDAQRGQIVVQAAAAEGQEPDPGLLADLADMLAAGAVDEAAHLVARGLGGSFAADSAAGRLVLAQLWLTGQWAMARRLFLAQPATALEDALADSPHLLGRILIEIWAEFRFARLCKRLRAPGFAVLAARALTEAGRTALRGGALDFAVIVAAGDAPPPAGVEEGLDALAGRLHGVPPARVAAARAAAGTLRAGFGLGFRGSEAPMMPEPPWEAGARIAPLNPYDGPLRALVAAKDRQGGSVLTRRLAALAPRLPDLARAYAPVLDGTQGLADRVTGHPPALVDALGAMGLTAEWSGGLAAVTRQADLSLIARAAERWRCTVCGDWAYPSPPPTGWTGTAPPDWGSRHLAADFAADPDPQGRARQALALWTGAAGPNRRLRSAAASVAGLPAGAALSALLQSGHPLSLAVPMAFLTGAPPAPVSPPVDEGGDP